MSYLVSFILAVVALIFALAATFDDGPGAKLFPTADHKVSGSLATTAVFLAFVAGMQMP